MLTSEPILLCFLTVVLTAAPADHAHTAGYPLTPYPPAAGGPAISKNGIANAASGLPGFSQNAYVSIYGSNLSTTVPGRKWTADDLKNGLPLSLDGTSVTINGKPAYVEYVSPVQVNVIAPWDAATGPVPVQVTVNGLASNTVMGSLQRVAPAFFTFDGKHLAATHADGTLVGPVGLFPGTPAGFTTPAKAGEVIILYGNGWGATSPAPPEGQPTQQFSPMMTMPAVMVGGSQASLVGGLVAPFAALYQINVTLPATLGNGDQPVFGTAEGITSENTSACCFLTVQN